MPEGRGEPGRCLEVYQLREMARFGVLENEGGHDGFFVIQKMDGMDQGTGLIVLHF